MKTLTILALFFFYINSSIAQNNSVDLCGCNLAVLSRSYEKGYRRIELEYGIFTKRYYNKNGKIEKDIVFSRNHDEILINTYSSKGKIKKQKFYNDYSFNICYAVTKAIKADNLGTGIYIKSFKSDSWEYPDSWFVGKDSAINFKLEESFGLIINKKSGKESQYYTRKTYPWRSKEKEEEQFIIWNFDDKRAKSGMSYEKLRNFLTPDKDFISNDIIHGMIVVSFGIDESGNIFDSIIIQGINEYQDNEALRLINSMPNWIPAENSDGDKIKDYFTLGVYFNNEK